MTTTPDSPDFRALAQELVETWDATADFNFNDFGHAATDLIYRARAALATPPPKPPTDEELWEIWNNHDGPIPAILRAALERWGR